MPKEPGLPGAGLQALGPEPVTELPELGLKLGLRMDQGLN